MQTEKSIDRIVRAVEQVPTLPIISQRIQNLFIQDEVSIRQVSDIIEHDPPLAVKILKIVNSSFFGLLNNVSSIDHALVILGFEEVRNIVLGFSIQNFFNMPSNSFDRKHFWAHSIICSQIAKYLGRHFKIVDDGTFFLSGLIHDLGKLVSDQYLHNEFEAIIDYISETHATFTKAEKDIMGVTHYQIGAKLLQQWHFPKKVIMQIFYHHAPWYDKNYTSGSIILYLANLLTKLAGYPCHQDEKQISIADVLNPSILDFINKNGLEIDQEECELLISHIHNFIAAEENNVLSIFD